MKAWVLHDIGDFRLETAADPEIGENEVLAAVKAAGICGSDIPRVYRTGTYSYPLIPGHEFSGIVAEAGAGVDKKWLGRRVGVFPLIPCGACEPCRKKQFEMCRNYSYLGSRRNGAFAEYVAVPAENLVELPEGVSFLEAAMLEPMAVAVHAMRRAAPAAEDITAVCGLGTIGTLMLMFLIEAGIKNIFAIGNKDFQRKTAVTLGLPEECFCDIRKHNAVSWMMERTKGRGVDVYFECVGKNETIVQAVNMAAPSGRIVLTGNPGADLEMEKGVYWKILRSQLTLTGTWNSSFMHAAEDDWHYVLERLEQRRIAPAELISHRYSLEDVIQGFQIMRDKKEDYMKVMAETVTIHD